jgi:hypothetical protein
MAYLNKPGQAAPSEVVLAAASGSDGGLGLIGTVPVGGVLYVRFKATRLVV